LQNALAACGVVVEQQPAVVMLPSGVQPNGVPEQMNMNASLQTSRLNTNVNSCSRTAVVSGE